jgi:hypothetical protein
VQSLQENIFFQTGVFDGVAGNPNDLSGTHVILNNEDGLLISNAIYYSNGNTVCQLLGDHHGEIDEQNKYIKMGFSYWYYTEKYEYLFSHLINWGFYGMFEMDVWKESFDPNQGISVHGRIGVANDAVNQFDYFLGGGLGLYRTDPRQR